MKRKTTEEFIDSAKKVHSDRYDYSLVDYKNAKIKVKIICKEHGVFEQIPSSHLRNHNCPKCSAEKTANLFRNDPTEIIKKFNIVYDNEYDYSLVDYKNTNTKVKIICKSHGIFEQTPKLHLRGHKCPKCYYKNVSDRLKNNKEDFIFKSNNTHNSIYDYSLVNYNDCRTKIKIICPLHGIFEQIPYIHIQGAGCPICNESRNEKIIRKILNDNNIIFETQKTFNGCKFKNKLKFDFYLPNYNLCIEYDGEQHYKPLIFFGGEKALKLQKIKDKIKTDYCLNNNIQLIRIKYNENIEEKLNFSYSIIT